MAKLTTAARKKLPKSDFAEKGTRKYPIPDAAHARDALSRSSGKPDYAAVVASVKRNFPKIKITKSEKWGPIDQETLGRHLKGAEPRIHYIAGPPAMVKGLHDILNKAGVDDNDIRAEEFAGYWADPLICLESGPSNGTCRH